MPARSRSPSPPVQMGGFYDRRTVTKPLISDKKVVIIVPPTPPQAPRPSQPSPSRNKSASVAAPPKPNSSNIKSMEPDDDSDIDIAKIMIIATIVIVVIIFLNFLAPKTFSAKGAKDKSDADVFTGTYIAEPDSDRFSSVSASQSTSSMAYQFALFESQLQIGYKVDSRNSGQLYYEFIARPLTETDLQIIETFNHFDSPFQPLDLLDYKDSRKKIFHFVSGEPFKVMTFEDDMTSETMATITVNLGEWLELYESTPQLEVKRKFEDNGNTISVTYEADGVIFYKKFKKISVKDN